MRLGQQKTFLGIQGEIELSLPVAEDGIKELYIRFLLSEKTPEQWNDWEDLVLGLGDDFGFKIMGFDDRLLPCIYYFTLLIDNANFRMFQSRYQWNVDRDA